jgi:hypothetical protein
MPDFSAICNDLDVGNHSTYYLIRLSTSSTPWSSVLLDSGNTSMAMTTAGSRNPEITSVWSRDVYLGTDWKIW